MLKNIKDILKIFYEISIKKFFYNLIIIFSDYKKIIIFFMILPVIYYLIQIQFLFCTIFIIYYVLCFINVYFLKSNDIIECKELELNPIYIYRYSLYNIIIAIPKAKAFLFFYSLLENIFMKNKKDLLFYFTLILILILNILFKISIIFLFSVSYLSILVSSETIIIFFNIIYLNYNSKKALIQTILINCFILSSESIAIADEKRIIIEKDKIVFNSNNFMRMFLNKVKRPELFNEAFNSAPKTVSAFINNHYTYIQQSFKYKNKNIANNFTSNNEIKAVGLEGNKKITLKGEHKPNVMGDNKPNYLTYNYELDLNNSSIHELDESKLVKMNSFKKAAENHIITSKDDQMLNCDRNGFKYNKNATKVSEYAKEFKLPVHKDIEKITEFEKLNENYLNSDNGKAEYEIAKKIVKKENINMNEFNKIKNNDSDIFNN